MIYSPRTLADIGQIMLWLAEGHYSSEIFELMKSPFWRSEVVRFHDHDFCGSCDQLITMDYCEQCGQTMPSAQPLLFDCQMAAHYTAIKNKARR